MAEFLFQAGAQSFGDGSHPTTAGVLAALEAIDPAQFAPRIACDMGCGSGILALAIAARFQCPVIAADLERQAIETVHVNADENGLSEYILPVHSDGFRHPDIEAHAPFSLIVMNILAGPLLALAADAVARLEEGGALILSGILQWQEPQIRAAYEALGLELASRLVVGDWVTLCWGKP
jgi:ribosomal protein L11 methyltransferase